MDELSYCGLRKRLVEIGDYVIHLFDSYRQPHQVTGHARTGLLLRSELLVRGARRVDDETLGVTDISQQSRQPDVIDVADAWIKDKDGNPKAFVADRRFCESVVPVCRFENETLAEMNLYPVEVRRTLPRTERGGY